MERKCVWIWFIYSVFLCFFVNADSQLLTNTTNPSSVEDYSSDEEETVNPMFTNSVPCQAANQYIRLEQCWSDCEDKRLSERYDGLQNQNFSSVRYPYKLAIFNKDEFHISSNETFVTTFEGRTLSTWNATYWMDENFAYVCYPLSHHFFSCQHVSFDDDEGELSEDSRSLLIPAEKAAFGLDEFLIKRDENGVSYFICVPSAHPNVTTVRTVWVVGWIVSTISLIMTFVLSFTITQLNMKNNRSVLAHVAMLGLAYFILVLEYLVKQRSSAVCVVWATCRQYFFLSSFFWMNVLACDLCVKLSNMQMRHSLSKLSERRKFWYYGLYAWGLPLAISTATIVVELTASEHSALWPGFQEQCWFRTKTALVIFLYYYAPIAAVLLLNMVFFVITTVNLFKAGQGTARVNKDVNWQMFLISCKLLVLMGILWTMEVVSWSVGDEGFHWDVFDAINSFQGFYIFLIYMCKRTHLRYFASKGRELVAKLNSRQTGENKPSDIKMATFYKTSEVSNSTTVSGSSTGNDAATSKQTKL